ncbi:MAG: SpoIIE family protein phosphatase [Methylobacter sp.]|nr:SpoIIE family protein phosphatase [Methylobacter sp.]MDP2099029.1 SpoIIE family protein phosphatase [Methylobacter sp.]MDP2427612.1 SpoIIE family protein phosphatase [Methylobacter sp.]MDP3056857.1 SpoIIE family protein phosphatase [Methylobacter sp.]MDP3363504.1 SpoIIE family protein phosphatase [Methylobacter sp.]
MAVTAGYATRPLAGETVCGDSCGWWRSGGRIVLAVADGLGHGPEAAYASEAALACIANHLDWTCEDLFAECNTVLRDTRGVALAVAIIEPATGLMTVCTVGNIRVLLLCGSKDIRLDGGRGIVGAGYQKLAPEARVLAPGNILAMFSDGLDQFPVLRAFFDQPGVSAQEQAQAILDYCARGDDDASVLIYRHEI